MCGLMVNVTILWRGWERWDVNRFCGGGGGKPKEISMKNICVKVPKDE